MDGNNNSHHRKVGKKLGVGIIFAIVAVVVAAALGVGAYFSFKCSDKISANVYVNQISVGGLTVDEASRLLEKEISADYLGKTVVIKYAEEVFDADLLGVLTIDSEKTAENALSASNSFFKRIFKKEKITVPYELNIDDSELKILLNDFARTVEDKSGVFTFDDGFTSVSVDASKAESLLDVDKTLKTLYQNVANDVFDDIDAAVLKRDSKDFASLLFSRLEREPKNASVAMDEENSTYIVAEEFGVKANREEFERLYNEKNGVFEMDITPITPEITTEDLDIDFYGDVLGSYTSSYNMGLANRTKNLALAARLVNGTVIMPGQRFSYNKTVGPRTYARGFVDATVYTGEGTEEGIGGGICQVSSTIYCAQLRADLKTVSRTNHSYTVVYVPLGQDATVVYGALDYVFENNTNYPIKISAVAGGGYLTVKILGTKVDRTKSVDVVSVTSSVIEKSETQKDDSSIPRGQTVVKQSGQNGAVVNTYKVYYENGTEVKREYIGKSTYRPMNKIVLVGTGYAAVTEPEGSVTPLEPEPSLPDEPTVGDGEDTPTSDDPAFSENPNGSDADDDETKPFDKPGNTDISENEIELSENGL